ncbi:unnamed protein product [Durusdinium trenchii]|uniref:Hexosyltransferase n=1 Tax=Durusdinium trenchii TaxID=1381693 RepID=A0ABP0HNE2_9DINO
MTSDYTHLTGIHAESGERVSMARGLQVFSDQLPEEEEWHAQSPSISRPISLHAVPTHPTDLNLLGQPLGMCRSQLDSPMGWDGSGFCSYSMRDVHQQGVCVMLSPTFREMAKFEDGLDIAGVSGYTEGRAARHWCLPVWAFAAAVERDPKGMEDLGLDCLNTNSKVRDILRQNVILQGPSKSYFTKPAAEILEDRCTPEGIRLHAQRKREREKWLPQEQACVNKKYKISQQDIVGWWDENEHKCYEGFYDQNGIWVWLLERGCGALSRLSKERVEQVLEQDESIASKLVSELEGKVVHEVVAAGKEKLKGFGGGGGGGAAVAVGGGGGGGGGGEAAAKKAKMGKVNPSQRAAIDGLKFALEKIQGPPGTGKSTTIFHILERVTCSRNVAVESIAQKLSGLEERKQRTSREALDLWLVLVGRWIQEHVYTAGGEVGESARRYLLDSQVQIMVTSKLSSFERRQTLRDVFISCAARVATLEHDVEQLFFLGDAADVDEELRLGLKEEGARFNDLVFVGGPDADPAVERDVTYVLERPTARGFRLAIGTAWLAEHRPDLDYVMYLDDDSYLHLPRLLTALQAHGSPSLAMGYVMETQLDTLETHICTVCPLNCEACQNDPFLNEFCSHFPLMSLGGCAFLIHQCKLFGQDDAEGNLQACVQKAQRNTMQVVHYFGMFAPKWFLGMGWVFGRRIVQFLAKNAADLKKHGAADVQLGFWLAPLEGVHWVDMKEGQFHDYPMRGSTFANGCTEKTILVHRMNEERWKDFDAETCELHCPLTP